MVIDWNENRTKIEKEKNGPKPPGKSDIRLLEYLGSSFSRSGNILVYVQL